MARSPEVNGWHSKQATYNGTLNIPAVLEAARQVPRIFMGISEDLRYPYPASLPHLEAERSVHRDAWVLPGVEHAAVPLSLTPPGARDNGSPGGVLFYYLEPGLLEGSLIWTPPGASLVSRVNEVSWSDGAGGTHRFSALLPITWEHGLELCAPSCCMCSKWCFVLFTFFLFLFA